MQVADYPFTTLHPQLGTVAYSDGTSLTVADIPGVLPGASENRGLGHAFLRHIERSAAIAYVVSLSGNLHSCVFASDIKRGDVKACFHTQVYMWAKRTQKPLWCSAPCSSCGSSR